MPLLNTPMRPRGVRAILGVDQMEPTSTMQVKQHFNRISHHGHWSMTGMGDDWGVC